MNTAQKEISKILKPYAIEIIKSSGEVTKVSLDDFIKFCITNYKKSFNIVRIKYVKQ